MGKVFELKWETASALDDIFLLMEEQWTRRLWDGIMGTWGSYQLQKYTRHITMIGPLKQ